MRKLLILVLLLMQISMNIQGSGQNYENRAINWYAYGAALELATFESGLSCVDLMLVGVCLLLVMMHRKRRQMNTRIKLTIKGLKRTYGRNTDVVRGLGSSLEDFRSRNSMIEMPLRRMHRSCESMVKVAEQRINETECLHQSFKQQKDELQQSVKIPADIESHINDLRIKIELAALKKFVDSEVSILKMSCDLYSSMIAEAVDDVDRVFVAEGL